MEEFKFHKRLRDTSEILKNSNYVISSLDDKFDYFCKNGGVILENYFKEDVIDKNEDVPKFIAKKIKSA